MTSVATAGSRSGSLDRGGHRLAADHLSFSYAGRQILNDVSMEVRSGEIVGLIGPNGSGKTTLLRCLLGYLTPSAGRASIDDLEVARHDRRGFARRVASVTQETPTDVPLLAGELVLLGRVPHLPTRGLGFEPEGALERVSQALAECGVLELADRPLHQLSGGELRRVYLARALAQDASVLLLDEPIAGLDLRHQLAILQILERQARAGTAVLAVLHDVNLAARVCHRIVLLKQGSIVASGPPAEVLTPTHLGAVFDVDVRAVELPFGFEGWAGTPRQVFFPSLRSAPPAASVPAAVRPPDRGWPPEPGSREPDPRE